MVHGGEIMAGRWWWQQIFDWSWVVAVKLLLVWVILGGGSNIMAGCGWSFNLIIPINVNKTKSTEESMLKSTDNNGHLTWMFVLCLVKKFG